MPRPAHSLELTADFRDDDGELDSVSIDCEHVYIWMGDGAGKRSLALSLTREEFGRIAAKVALWDKLFDDAENWQHAGDAAARVVSRITEPNPAQPVSESRGCDSASVNNQERRDGGLSPAKTVNPLRTAGGSPESSADGVAE